MSTIMITEIMERHIKSMCSEYGSYIVKKLSEKYGFDAEEASREVELPSVKRVDVAAPRRKDVTEKKPKAAKAEKAPVPSIPLPFCGKAVDGWCLAIVKNNKLYTQCTNTPSSDDGLCKKCVKLVEKDGELPFGLIASRLECDTYKDAKGNSPISYAAVMAKMNITREAAEAEAAKFGLTIPEEQFVVVEKSRGRPKKEAAEKSDDENSEKSEKKRGRPKKDKPMKATSKVGDDIIAGLLSQAKANGEIEDEVDSNPSSSNSGNDEASSEAETVAPVVKAVEKKPKQAKQSAEEKAAAKEAAKAAKEAEKAAAKAAKEAEKAAAKAAKEADKPKPKKATKAAEKKADVPTVAAVAAVADPKPITITGGVAETKPSTKDETSCEEEEYSEEEEEAEEIKVKKFEHGGKKYKRSEPDNILYDWETDEAVGVWNEKTKKIDELPSESEEEDDE